MFDNGNTKLLPPDGGWGYAVAVADVIVNVATQSFACSFDVLYENITSEMDISSAGINTLRFFNAVCFVIASFFTGPLLKVMTERKATLLSAVLINIGMLAQVFVSSKNMFMMCQFLMSFGSGWIIIVVMSSVNSYFVEKKYLIFVVIQFIPALTSLWAPLFLKWSLEFYGDRSTFLLAAGLTMHNFIAGVILHPVAWHMKQVKHSPESTGFLVNNITARKDSKIVTKELPKDLVVKISINEGPETVGSKVSIGKVHLKSENIRVSKGVKSTVKKALDWYMYKDFHFVNACLGIALTTFSDALFMHDLPNELENMKWSKIDISSALSFYGFGDIAGRIVLIIFSKQLVKFGSKPLFMVGLAMSVMNRVGMIWSEQQTVIVAYITTMGVSHSLLTSMVPLILAELVTPRQFPSALGVNTLFYGVFTLMLTPVMGGIRDLTGSTPTMFCLLTSFFAVVLLFWAIEICYVRNEKKTLQRKIETELIKKNQNNKRKRFT